jgi:hypothetical protein
VAGPYSNCKSPVSPFALCQQAEAHSGSASPLNPFAHCWGGEPKHLQEGGGALGSPAAEGCEAVLAGGNTGVPQVLTQTGALIMDHSSPAGVVMGATSGATGAAAGGQQASPHSRSPVSASTPRVSPSAARGRRQSPQQQQPHISVVGPYSHCESPVSPFALCQQAGRHSSSASPGNPFPNFQGGKPKQLQGTEGAWGLSAKGMGLQGPMGPVQGTGGACQPPGDTVGMQGPVSAYHKFVQQDGRLSAEQIRLMAHEKTQELLFLQRLLRQHEEAAAAAAAARSYIMQQEQLDPRTLQYNQGAIGGFGQVAQHGGYVVPAPTPATMAAAAATGFPGVAGSLGARALGQGPACLPGIVSTPNQQQRGVTKGTGRPRKGPKPRGASSQGAAALAYNLGTPAGAAAGRGGMGMSAGLSSIAAVGQYQQQQQEEEEEKVATGGWRLETEKRGGGAERWHPVRYIFVPKNPPLGPGELPPVPLSPAPAAAGGSGAAGGGSGKKRTHEEQMLPRGKRQNVRKATPQAAAAAQGPQGGTGAQPRHSSYYHVPGMGANRVAASGVGPGLGYAVPGGVQGVGGPAAAAAAAGGMAGGMMLGGGAGAGYAGLGAGGQSYMGLLRNTTAGGGVDLGGVSTGINMVAMCGVSGGGVVSMSGVEYGAAPVAAVEVGGVAMGQVDGSWQQARV